MDTEDEQAEKKAKSDQEEEALAAQMMNTVLEPELELPWPFSTCPSSVSQDTMDDWRHWICVAQDMEGMKTIQVFFNMYVKTGFGVSYLSKKGTGFYILMCEKCMNSYAKQMHTVSEAASADDIQQDMPSLKCAPKEEFKLLQIIARLTYNQIRSKLRELKD